MTRPKFSFEFFPPKTQKTADALWACVPELVALNPEFMTVTYGAGGSTKDGTIETIQKHQGLCDIPIASHLTFLNTTKEELNAYIDDLWDRGIKHIVALRGDMPDGLSWPLNNDNNYFQYTSDFVTGILERHPFDITVGAYPEKHPDADSLDADILALKLKCEAGAHRAFTQFFFDNDIYYRFIEKCEKAGITTPIYPGLLPIHDFKSMCGFAKKCHTHIPDWLHEQFTDLENTPEEAKKRATELLTTQTEDLARNGVKHIHYYTLNKADITKDAVAAISNQ